MTIIESTDSYHYADRAENYLQDFVRRTGVNAANYCVEKVVKDGGVGVFRIREAADQPLRVASVGRVSEERPGWRYVDSGENAYTGVVGPAVRFEDQVATVAANLRGGRL